jgi:hypothetical protein
MFSNWFSGKKPPSPVQYNLRRRTRGSQQVSGTDDTGLLFCPINPKDTDSSVSSLSRSQNLKLYRRPSMLSKQITLVLDLDETLIHSSSRFNSTILHDATVEVLIDKSICLYYVYKRPNVDHFLRVISEWYNVVIFTASMAEVVSFPLMQLVRRPGHRPSRPETNLDISAILSGFVLTHARDPECVFKGYFYNRAGSGKSLPSG